MLRLWVLTLCCGCWTQALWATSIVAIWTPNGALIGADAKMVTGAGEDAGTTCKIGRIGNNILWAQSGIFGVPSVKVNFGSVIIEGLNSGGSLDDRISKIEHAIVPTLTELFNAPLVRPDIIRDIHNKKAKGVQFIVLFSDERGTRAIGRDLLPTEGRGGKIEITIKPDGCPGGTNCTSPQLFTLGLHKAVDKEAKRNTAIWNGNPVDAVLHLLRTARRANPREVGEPFSVASIIGGNITWPVPGNCQQRQ